METGGFLPGEKDLEAIEHLGFAGLGRFFMQPSQHLVEQGQAPSAGRRSFPAVSSWLGSRW